MVPRRIPFVVAAALAVAVAATAAAFTIPELQSRAEALDQDFDGLLADVQVAQESEHAALQAELQALEADRLQLVADRQSLGACACTQLDALLSEIAFTSETVQVIVSDWEE